MKIVITSVMSFVQNCVCDRYASWIPQGERYEGLIRHLFLAPRALSSRIVSATPLHQRYLSQLISTTTRVTMLLFAVSQQCNVIRDKFCSSFAAGVDSPTIN